MVEIIWTEPALSDLDAIADFIALENPIAARKLVLRTFNHVEKLTNHPESGKIRWRVSAETPVRVPVKSNVGRHNRLHLH